MPSSRRKITIRSILLLLAFLSVLPSLSAQQQIEWEAVTGANYYRVEIRQDDELILETRSDTNALPLFLPPGDYRFQVKVINSFGKIALESDWSSLKITVAQRPFIVSFTPRMIHENTNVDFVVRAEGWNSDTRFVLENAAGRQIPLTAEPEDNGKVILRAEKRQPNLGSWTLLMMNETRTDRMESALTVTESLQPRIRKFSPRQFVAGKSHNQAVIKIAGQEDGALVSVTGPSEIPFALIRKHDERIFEYSLNLSNALPGRYGLKVINPSGREDERKRLFEVKPAPPTAEEIAAALRLPIDDKPVLPLPEYPSSVLLGWNMNFPTGKTSDYFLNGYAGFSLSFSQPFRNSLFRRISLFEHTEWALSIIYNYRPTNYPLIELNLQQFSFLFGLRYITPFNSPVNLILRAEAGPSVSIVSSPDAAREDIRDRDSVDFSLRFGAAARIDIGARWFVDLGCDLPVTFYLSRTSWSIQPRLEGGYRW